MSKRTASAAAAVAIAWALLTFPMPAMAQSFSPCSAKEYPGLTFGSGVPTYAVGALDGVCYCGIWTNVTPQQAVDQGWYASCNGGKGICNFAPGTRASNQVCGPFK